MLLLFNLYKLEYIYLYLKLPKKPIMNQRVTRKTKKTKLEVFLYMNSTVNLFLERLVRNFFKIE